MEATFYAFLHAIPVLIGFALLVVFLSRKFHVSLLLMLIAQTIWLLSSIRWLYMVMTENYAQGGPMREVLDIVAPLANIPFLIGLTLLLLRVERAESGKSGMPPPIMYADPSRNQ